MGATIILFVWFACETVMRSAKAAEVCVTVSNVWSVLSSRLNLLLWIILQFILDEPPVIVAVVQCSEMSTESHGVVPEVCESLQLDG